MIAVSFECISLISRF